MRVRFVAFSAIVNIERCGKRLANPAASVYVAPDGCHHCRREPLCSLPHCTATRVAFLHIQQSICSTLGNPPIFSRRQKWNYAVKASFCMGVIPPGTARPVVTFATGSIAKGDKSAPRRLADLPGAPRGVQRARHVPSDTLSEVADQPAAALPAMATRLPQLQPTRRSSSRKLHHSAGHNHGAGHNPQKPKSPGRQPARLSVEAATKAILSQALEVGRVTT